MADTSLTNVRLKGVMKCPFNRSEVSNLGQYRREEFFPGELKPGEAYLFLSKGLDQAMFVFATHQSADENGVVRSVVDSRRLRLTSGSWSPYMLQNDANAVGLSLLGIKRFEQIYAEHQALKKEGSR